MTSYDSTCTSTGQWSREEGCLPFYCQPLVLDLATVSIETLGVENLLHTTVTASCQGEGEDFNFGYNILSVEYTCAFK